MGGVIGHIQHPYENLSLKFKDLYSLISFITSGEYIDLNGRHYLHATEKLDGQQLSISWLNDKGLVIARNKGHVKNFGITALDRDALIDKFKNHICFEAFLYAYDSLDHAMLDLTYDQKNQIFDNGRKWMSLEVIYPDTTNIIPYNQNLIFFHYTVRYDQDGNSLSLSNNDADKLFKMLPIKKYENYTFESPRVIKLPDLSDYNIRFFNQIKSIIKSYDIGLNYTIGDFLEVHFRKILYRHLNFIDDGTVCDKILRRFVYGDKSFTLPQIKKIDEGLARWVKTYEKEELLFELKYARRPLEKCFLELGTLLIYKTSDKEFLLKGNKISERILAKRVRDSLDIIPIVEQRLNHQIYLLSEINNGLPDHIPTTEGIVFDYKGELYKLTGSFAPINQLLGQRF